MIRKVISYEDYNGEKQTDEAWFHISKAELMELEYSKSGGLSTMIKTLSETNDMGTAIGIFKELISKAYGRKTPTGKFVKNKEFTDEFMASEAYSELFMELATNVEAGSAFFIGVMPAELQAEISKQKQEETVSSQITKALEEKSGAEGNA